MSVTLYVIYYHDQKIYPKGFRLIHAKIYLLKTILQKETHT
uniref:Uncharacterized protein n=1 Tax=Manihot esculenta TaxID=3983 RepID=A0A2C9WHP9_MANES